MEPSLQAAFVEYGGNRHGFLAFNEIHPDYYQIPLADRQALLEEEAREAEEYREREERRRRSPRRSRGRRAEARSRRDETVSAEDSAETVSGVVGEEIRAADLPDSLPDTLSDNAEAVREELATEGTPVEGAEAEAEPSSDEPVAASTELDAEVPAEARIALAEELTNAEEPQAAAESRAVETAKSWARPKRSRPKRPTSKW